FLNKKVKPGLDEFEQKIKKFHLIEQELEEMTTIYSLDSLEIDIKKLRMSLLQEATAWKHAYGQALNQSVKESMDELITFMEETETALNRKIEDLEAVNNTMNVLEKMREVESNIEGKLKPIEDAYNLLN